MRILISIGHPAHVHYFKNTARVLESKGNKVLFFIRDRECIVELIEKLGFDYFCYGKGGSDMVSKMVNIPYIDYKLLKVALKFKPDYLLSFSSPYAAHVSKLIGKPHIAFDDTEHAKLGQKLYRPFTDVILSPYTYSAQKHKRQILIDSLMDIFYLHKKYYNPDNDVLRELNLCEEDRYCIVRFVSWNANHDVGIRGLSYQDKINIVIALSNKYKVFISSEGQLPKELEQFRLTTHSSKFHDVISSASLCISEGSTTASEAVVLGVPAIYVNPLKLSYCDEEERFGLMYQLLSVNEIIKKSIDILDADNSHEIYRNRRNEFVLNMIDPTAFLVWFLENYPNSRQIMRENPKYQDIFKHSN